MRFLWQQIPNATVSEILCSTGMDGVVLDTEHGVFSNETLFNCIQVITLTGKKCFVRVTDTLNRSLIRYCLDSGADGLIFSTIENGEQAYHAATQCCFPGVPNSKGVRGFGLTRDNFWGEKEREKKITIIAQIETKNGVDFIRHEPNWGSVFDYFLIGPYDLSSSLGDVGNFSSLEYQKAIETIKNAVGEEKMGYHIVKNIPEQYPNLKGCGFLAFGLDTLMLINGVKELADYES